MTRKLASQIHLYLAMFLAPIMLMIAISGGLYLFGFKGDTVKTDINVNQPVLLNLADANLEQQVRDLLTQHGQDSEFEYIKQGGNTLYTRPTSTTHFMINLNEQEVTLTKVEPDLVKSLVELHKGHGPLAFKTLQKVTAIGLIVLLITGVIMALYNRRMKMNASISFTAGCLVFFWLAFL